VRRGFPPPPPARPSVATLPCQALSPLPAKLVLARFAREAGLTERAACAISGYWARDQSWALSGLSLSGLGTLRVRETGSFPQRQPRGSPRALFSVAGIPSVVKVFSSRNRDPASRSLRPVGGCDRVHIDVDCWLGPAPSG
jgi:hypothetical protein